MPPLYNPPLQFGTSHLYDTRTPSYFCSVRLVLDSDSLEQKLLDGGTVYPLHCLMFLDCLIFPGLCIFVCLFVFVCMLVMYIVSLYAFVVLYCMCVWQGGTALADCQSLNE